MNVISDMVGTVTTGYPIIGLIKWARKNRSAFRANLFLGRHLVPYLLAKRGLVDTQKLGQSLMHSSLALISDPTPESLIHMGEWSVDYELWPKRRQAVLTRLAGHIEEGAQVYLASSIFEPTVKAFAQRIGAHPIGTPVEIVDGRVRFAEAFVAEERKSERVLSELGVDWVEAAYGDTWADIPLLEKAERPVAVYPDRVLRATPLERGWEILDDRAGNEVKPSDQAN